MQPISFFFRAAARYPNATAVIAPDRQLTFAQLGGQVTQLAAYLAAEDPRPQTSVCVGCGNSIEHLIAILAVSCCVFMLMASYIIRLVRLGQE